MVQILFAIVLFVAISGLLAMVDAAVLSVSPAEVEVMVQKQRFGAFTLKNLLRHSSRTISTIVILANVTNILGPILIGRTAEAIYGSQVIGVITALLTIATIVFSEIIPKSIGVHRAPLISRFAAPILQVLEVCLYPAVIGLEAIVKLFRTKKRKVGTEEQIRALTNLGRGAGHIDADESNLIHRAFGLNDRRARDIMTPTAKIVSIPSESTTQQAAHVMLHHPFSRYPIYDGKAERFTGYVLDREILEEVVYTEVPQPIKNLIRPVINIAADIRCDELLNILRQAQAQVAIVMQNNTAQGMITLEDVLEELVGEIEDETQSTAR